MLKVAARTTLRGIAIAGLAASFLTASALLGLRTPESRLIARRARLASVFARWTLQALGVHYSQDKRADLTRSKMIVCNHLSYLDPLILSALQPTGFVTSVEVREHWFLGPICRMAGCLFVERRSRDRIAEEIACLQSVFESGTSVTVFPEATTSEGARVLPFKSSLFESAIRTGCDVLPLCIRYTNPIESDRVCYYGDMTFFAHFFGLLGVERIEARIRILEAITATPGFERKALSTEAYRRVSEGYARA